MKCKTLVPAYSEILNNLIKSNNQYLHFDKILKFVMSAKNLTSEKKVEALHNFSLIYKSYNGFSKNVVLGENYSMVLNAIETNDTNESVLKAIGSSFTLNKRSINDQIIDILNEKVTTVLELNTLKGLITQEIVLKELSKEEKIALKEKYIGIINHKNNSKERVIRAIEEATAGTSYVNINNLTSLDNKYIVEIPNGDIVYAEYNEDEDKYYVDGKEINEDDIISSRIVRKQHNRKGIKGGKELFNHSLLESGFSIKALDVNDQKKLEKAIRESDISSSDIKIKIETIKDVNTKILDDLKKENDLLITRDYETFESDTQIRLLENDASAKVITVRRPSSKDDIRFYGEINGIKFSLYNLSNLVIVDSFNHTIDFNFNDKSHIDILKKMGVKDIGRQYSSLTEDDINYLIKNKAIFDKFKEKVYEQGDVDITDAFLSEYSLDSSMTKEYFSLEDAKKMGGFDELFFTEDTVKIINGEEVITKNRKFVLSFQKRDELVLSLDVKNGEKILVDGKKLTEREYLEHILNTTSAGTYENIDDVINDIFRTDLNKNVKATESAYLLWKERKPSGVYFSYKPVNYISRFSRQSFAFAWLYQLSRLDISEEGVSEHQVKRFNTDYGFSFFDTKQKEIGFLFDFSKGSDKVGGRLQIEVKGGLHTKESPLRKIINDSSLFKINMEGIKAEVDRFFKNIDFETYKKTDNINAPEIIKYDNVTEDEGYSTESLEKFFNTAQGLIDEGIASPELIKLVQSVKERINKTQASIIKGLNRGFIKTLEKIVEKNDETSKELLKVLRENYTYIDDGNNISDFKLERLYTDEVNGGINLSIKRDKNISIERDTLIYNEVKDIRISRIDNARTFNQKLKKNKAQEIVIPKENVSEEEQSNITKTEKKHIKTKEETKAKTDTIIEEDEEDPDNNIAFEINSKKIDDSFQEASEWLKESLPQIEISEKDISEIIDLSSIDGRVLGAFKDKVIYLNSKFKNGGTIYHEAFHGVFQHILNSDERGKLLTSIYNTKKHSKRFTKKAIKEFKETRNYNLTDSQAKEKIAEEILADGFKEYKENKKKPRGIVGKFFDMLKKLISFFTNNKDFIEEIYGNIDSGKYKAIELTDYNSLTSQDFEIIPSLKEVYINDNKGISSRNSVLSNKEQSSLVNMVLNRVLMYESKIPFEAKLNKAIEEVLDIYDISHLMDANEGIEEEIYKELGSLYSKYRFILGARMNEETNFFTEDINLTGDDSITNNKTRKSIVIVDGEEIDNTDGSYSLSVLKAMVRKKANDILNFSFDEDMSQDLKTMDDEELDEALNGEVENFNDYGQTNVISDVVFLRKFLSTIERPIFNKNLGIEIPGVIDGVNIFPRLLQITADVHYDNIIESIKQGAEDRLLDGLDEEYRDLMAVYDKIVDVTGIVDGKPTVNKNIYNLMVEVLNISEIERVSIDLRTNIYTTDENTQKKTTTAFTKDILLHTDVLNKKNIILNSIGRALSNTKNKLEHKKAFENTIAAFKKIKQSSIINPIIVGLNEADGNKLVSDIHDNLKILGFNFPKSLIRMSLVAIDVDINNNSQIPDYYKRIYDFNQKFISEGSYLVKSFFTSASSIFELMYNNDGIKTIEKYNDAINKKYDRENIEFNKFVAELNSAVKYIVKRDTAAIIPVVKNPEGKLVYRYGKLSPLKRIDNTIKQKGLLKFLQLDSYSEMGLMNFLQDNPDFGSLLYKLRRGEELTQKEKEIDLLLRNLDVKLFEGVNHFLNNKSEGGQSFKNLDGKSLLLAQLIMFQKKKEIVEGDTNIIVYGSSFHQLESLGSNFLLNRKYNRLAVAKMDKNPGTNIVKILGAKTYKENYFAIVEDFENLIKQEYNRIAREYSRRKEQAKKFNNNDDSHTLVLGYNAKLKEDRVSADTESADLRAYNFSSLESFWNTYDKDESIRNKLIDAAKKGVDFSESNLINIRSLLNKHIEKEYFKYVEKLEENGIIKIDEEDALKYSSDLLMNYTYLDYDSIKNSEIYKRKNGPLQALILDFFMNDFRSRSVLNQLVDGDKAVGLKNDRDMTKRQKKQGAGGPIFKGGEHIVAYIDTIKEYMPIDYPGMGPYANKSEIYSDTLYEQLEEDDKIKVINGFEDEDQWISSFDGQSITSLMHQADYLESIGRLSDESKKLIIKKHYKSLTKEEKNILKAARIVLNSKKTITSDRYVYHKLSEYFIDRGDVSYIKNWSKEAEAELHSLYNYVYNLRKLHQKGEILNKEYLHELKNKMILIHDYFAPLPGKEIKHDLLNSMEFYGIDQVMDTEASKNATRLPVNITEKQKERGYIPLHLSSIAVLNEVKYMQNETSKIHHEQNAGVQKKLLLPANVSNFIKERVKENNLSNEEEKDLILLNEALSSYNESLINSANARVNFFNKFIKKDNSINIKEVYEAVQAGLAEQGASVEEIARFDFKDGKPLIDPNIGMIGRTLEFYFFNLYSSNITNEKVSGFKMIHESPYGHKVVVDENDDVVSDDLVKEAPLLYKSYRTRNLKVAVEFDEATNTKVYYAECIVPRPDFMNKEDEEFYLEYLNRMFAVRIPTEDKRSMIVMKVVGFMDGSKTNSVIVPQLIHRLAGSDFDIDALYVQSMASYKDLYGKNHLYGDYSSYLDPIVGRYIEFLHYIKNHKYFKSKIKLERALMMKSDLEISSDLLPILNEYFPESTEDEIQEMINKIGEYDEEDLDNIKEIISGEFDDKKEIKDKLTKHDKEFIKKIKKISEKIEKASAEKKNAERKFRESGRKDHYYTQHASILSLEIQALQQELKELNNSKFKKESLSKMRDIYSKIELNLELKDEIFKSLNEDKKIIYLLKEYIPIIRAVNVTYSNFDHTYTEMVDKIYQNDNLQASINILGNKEIYDSMYSKEITSDVIFEDALNRFGLTVESMTSKGDINTPTALVELKEESSGSKEAVSSSASINKFLGFASTIGVELNKENVIWKYKDKDGNKIYRSKFDVINEQGFRSIKVVGAFIGMATDAVKKPLPAALGINNVNKGTYLAMLGLGISVDMATGFNYIPELRIAAKKVQDSLNAVKTEENNQPLFYNNEINVLIRDMLKDDKGLELFNSLKDKGIITSGNQYRQEINTSNIVFEFAEKRNLDPILLKQNKLTTKNIGFKLSINNESLTEDEQKFVLLTMYSNQVSQSFKLQAANSINAFLKKINPEFIQFDKLLKNIETVADKNKSIFTKESIDKIFNDKAIYSIAINTFSDLNKESGNLFIERSELFSGLNAEFEKLTKDRSVLRHTIVGTIALAKYKKELLERKSKNKIVQEMLDEDNENLKDAFSIKSKFDNKLFEEVLKFKEEFPDNLFLNKIIPINSLDVEDNEKQYSIRFSRLVNISDDEAVSIREEMRRIYNSSNEGRLFIKKLFYNELIRTGLKSKEGNFLNFLPEEMLHQVSNNITQFIEDLKNNNVEIDEDVLMDVLNKSALALIKDKQNSKIPNYKKIWLSQKKGTPHFVQKVINIFKIEDAVKKSNELLNSTFGFTEGSFNLIKNTGNKLVIQVVDSKGNENQQQYITEEIGRLLRIDTVAEKGKIKYDYPMVYQIGDKYFMLKKIDGNNAASKIFEGNTVGSTAEYDLIDTKALSSIYDFLFMEDKDFDYLSNIDLKTTEETIIQEENNGPIAKMLSAKAEDNTTTKTTIKVLSKITEEENRIDIDDLKSEKFLEDYYNNNKSIAKKLSLNEYKAQVMNYVINAEMSGSKISKEEIEDKLNCFI